MRALRSTVSIVLPALLLGVALTLLASPARAEEPNPWARSAPAAASPAAVTVAAVPLSARCCPNEPYVPAALVPENRASFLAPIVPPTPFLLTQGEATTPCRGYATVFFQRISDERRLQDNVGNLYHSDGEVQIVTAEWVSPTVRFPFAGRTWSAHLGVSLDAYTLEHALYDRLRNSVEDSLLSGNTASLGHFLGGRDLDIDRPNGEHIQELGSSPMWKAKIVGKVQLPSLRTFRTHLDSAFSVGLTPPSFGAHTDSGNDGLQADATWAFAVPLSTHFRFSGAAALLFPGSSPLLDRIGLKHEDVLFAAHGDLTWWITERFAFSAGVSFHTHYLRDSGLPMDLDSTYVNLGIMFRADRHSTFSILFSENVEPTIKTAPGQDYSNSQKESDFNLSLGWRWVF